MRYRRLYKLYTLRYINRSCDTAMKHPQREHEVKKRWLIHWKQWTHPVSLQKLYFRKF